MKYLLKIFIFSSLLICVKSLPAQVTGVQYAIAFNNNTNLFDCFLYITDGEASSVIQRVQFNSQYSIATPTGTNVSVEYSHMPLIDNQNFSGILPMEWAISSKVTSPSVSPEYDFYGITPKLAPAGFYNTLKEGDLIKLFSVRIEGDEFDHSMVRIFNNENDPRSFEEGMLNGDFSNGFTLGGYTQLFKGIRTMSFEGGNLSSLDDNKG